MSSTIKGLKFKSIILLWPKNQVEVILGFWEAKWSDQPYLREVIVWNKNLKNLEKVWMRLQKRSREDSHIWPYHRSEQRRQTMGWLFHGSEKANQHFFWWEMLTEACLRDVCPRLVLFDILTNHLEMVIHWAGWINAFERCFTKAELLVFCYHCPVTDTSVLLPPITVISFWAFALALVLYSFLTTITFRIHNLGGGKVRDMVGKVRAVWFAHYLAI